MAGRKQSGSPLPRTTRLGGILWLLPLALLVLGACPHQAQAGYHKPAPTCPIPVTAANSFGHQVVLFYKGGNFRILNMHTKVLSQPKQVAHIIHGWPAHRSIDAYFNWPRKHGLAIVVSGKIFYKVIHKRVVFYGKLSKLYGHRYHAYGHGVDAIATVGTTVLSFRGCQVLVGNAFTLSLPDIGLPCHLDAAWTFANNAVVVVKGPLAFKVILHGHQAHTVPLGLYCK